MISLAALGPLVYTCAAILLLSIGLHGNHIFLQCDFFTKAVWSTPQGYTVSEFNNLVLGCYFTPIGLLFLLVAIVQCHNNKFWYYWQKLVLFYTLFGIDIYGIYYGHSMCHEVLQCGIYCLGNEYINETPSNSAGTSFLGLIYFFLGLLLLFFLTYVILINHYLWYVSLSGRRDDEKLIKFPSVNSMYASTDNAAGGTIFKHQIVHKNNRLFYSGVVFFVFYPLLVFTCMALPDWWAYFTPKAIQANLASRPDKHVTGYYWSFDLGGSNGYLKLWPDILMYYLTIYIVAITSFICQFYKPLRTFFHTKHKLIPFSLCIGEVVLGLILLGLLFGECCYFYYDHGWQDTKKSAYTKEERAARTMGQVAAVCMGLLILPVSKNSVWSELFGVSYESMVQYHKYIGGLFFLVCSIHMILWWKVYDLNHMWPENIIAIPSQYHQDNFTIPLMSITFVFLVVFMGLGSIYFIRRHYYEVFYYSHHFFMIFFIVVLWHATMAWYFIIGGLVLWVVDHIIKIGNAVGMQVQLVNVTTIGNEEAVQLEYTTKQLSIYNIIYNGVVAVFTGEKRSDVTSASYEMGQYYFINIPSISTLEWHPFSISSSPEDVNTTHHIKNMGSEQWTGKLAQLAGLSSVDLARTSLIIDGPYGIPLNLDSCKSVLFIAGGIGITPIHSCIRHLYFAMRDGSKKYAHIERVRLVWPTRSKAINDIFDDSWSMILSDNIVNNGNIVFSVEKYVTSKGSRPDIANEIIGLARSYKNSDAALVFACGPKSLVDNCEKLTTQYNVPFKRETFLL